MVDLVVAAAAVLHIVQKFPCQQSAPSPPFPQYQEICGSFQVWRTMIEKHCREINLRDSPSTSGDGLAAGTALPDTNSSALNAVLAAECADVTGVLGDFHLLHLLSERGTVSIISPRLTFDLLPSSSFEQ